MLLAVLCVTIMSVQAKLVGIEYHAAQITFVRAIVVLIFLFPLIYKLGGLNFLKTNKPILHFFRGLAGLTGNIMFFLAFQRLPVADVTVISQAVPIFASILAIIFLKEIIGWRRWLAIIVGFLGVIIAINPTGQIAVASFLTQLLMTYALQKAPASIVSPFNYTGIIWAIIFDYLIWNSHPVFTTILGGIIITISGIYIFRREAKLKKIR